MATYTLITDTHGYPWGQNFQVDFDLGDNTPSSTGTFQEAIHETKASAITLLGNHDTEYLLSHGYTYDEIIEEYGLQQYPKSLSGFNINSDVVFFGLNSTFGLHDFRIETSVLEKLAEKLESLPAGAKIAILTHVPLFPYDEAFGTCYGSMSDWKSGRWESQVENGILQLLKRYEEGETFTISGKDFTFKSGGQVVGCFCGHVHNSIKCYYKGFYMEAFKSNGANEYTTESNGNQAMYQPEIQKIVISGNTVNGKPFSTDEEDLDFNDNDINHTNMGKAYMNASSAYYQFNEGDGFTPRFYDGVYIGYTTDKEKKTNNLPNDNNGYYQVDDDIYINGSRRSATYVRFDAAGELRYYGSNSSTTSEIPNYQNSTVTFTTNSVNWEFEDGLLHSVAPVYAAGELFGKNGYSIRFDSNGYATGIWHNGSKYPDTDNGNWINVYNLRVYWRPFTDLSRDQWEGTGATPQIGITNMFSDGNCRINLARNGTTDDNWIPDRYNVFLRIVGENNKVYWLYDGRLTKLTDEKVGIS